MMWDCDVALFIYWILLCRQSRFLDHWMENPDGRSPGCLRRRGRRRSSRRHGYLILSTFPQHLSGPDPKSLLADRVLRGGHFACWHAPSSRLAGFSLATSRIDSTHARCLPVDIRVTKHRPNGGGEALAQGSLAGDLEEGDAIYTRVQHAYGMFVV